MKSKNKINEFFIKKKILNKHKNNDFRNKYSWKIYRNKNKKNIKME